jgi:hypothetical protein
VETDDLLENYESQELLKLEKHENLENFKDIVSRSSNFSTLGNIEMPESFFRSKNNILGIGSDLYTKDIEAQKEGIIINITDMESYFENEEKELEYIQKIDEFMVKNHNSLITPIETNFKSISNDSLLSFDILTMDSLVGRKNSLIDSMKTYNYQKNRKNKLTNLKNINIDNKPARTHLRDSSISEKINRGGIQEMLD